MLVKPTQKITLSLFSGLVFSLSGATGAYVRQPAPSALSGTFPKGRIADTLFIRFINSCFHTINQLVKAGQDIIAVLADISQKRPDTHGIVRLKILTVVFRQKLFGVLLMTSEKEILGIQKELVGFIAFPLSLNQGIDHIDPLYICLAVCQVFFKDDFTVGHAAGGILISADAVKDHQQIRRCRNARSLLPQMYS